MLIRWPGTSDPKKYKALVDAGTQCTLMPLRNVSGVTGGSQQLTVVEAEVSLTRKEWHKHPIVTGPEALCILGIGFLGSGYLKDPKGHRKERQSKTAATNLQLAGATPMRAWNLPRWPGLAPR